MLTMETLREKLPDVETLREKLPSAGDVMQTLGLGNGRAQTSYTSTIAIFALGAAAGAAIAYLMSPRASELRGEVREQMAAWRERVAPSAPAPRTDWTEPAV